MYTYNQRAEAAMRAAKHFRNEPKLWCRGLFHAEDNSGASCMAGQYILELTGVQAGRTPDLAVEVRQLAIAADLTAHEGGIEHCIYKWNDASYRTPQEVADRLEIASEYFRGRHINAEG